MTRNRIKQILEWFHVLLVMAIILPTIYILGMQRESDMIFRLYIAAYLLVVPIIIIKIATQKCQKMIPYLLICVGMFAGVFGIAFCVGNLFLEKSVLLAYILFMLIGSFAVALQAYLVRMNQARQQKAREEMDRTWKQKEYALDKPNVLISFWFVCIYVVAKNFACPEVCNLAFISTICYLLVSITYQYIDRTEYYLNISDGICNVRNIPHKRIFGIGKYFLASYLLIIVLALVPAVYTVQYREYKDIREWIKQREVDYEELYEGETQKSYSGDPMADVTASYGPLKELPWIVKIAFYILLFVFLIGILRVAIKWMHKEMSEFAIRLEAEEDKVETIENSTEESIDVRKHLLKPKTEEEKVRREYRRFIRKHRKERPASYETPTEMEREAGVAGTPEGQELHVRYELVRYGKRE